MKLLNLLFLARVLQYFLYFIDVINWLENGIIVKDFIDFLSILVQLVNSCYDFAEDLVFWTNAYAEQPLFLYELFHKRCKIIEFLRMKKMNVQLEQDIIVKEQFFVDYLS